MLEFLVAIGLVFAIEGIAFAAFPGGMKRAMAEIARVPDGTLRGIGVASAVLGVLLIWLLRG